MLSESKQILITLQINADIQMKSHRLLTWPQPIADRHFGANLNPTEGEAEPLVGPKTGGSSRRDVTVVASSVAAVVVAVGAHSVGRWRANSNNRLKTLLATVQYIT